MEMLLFWWLYLLFRMTRGKIKIKIKLKNDDDINCLKN